MNILHSVINIAPLRIGNRPIYFSNVQPSKHHRKSYSGPDQPRIPRFQRRQNNDSMRSAPNQPLYTGYPANNGSTTRPTSTTTNSSSAAASTSSTPASLI